MGPLIALLLALAALPAQARDSAEFRVLREASAAAELSPNVFTTAHDPNTLGLACLGNAVYLLVRDVPTVHERLGASAHAHGALPILVIPAGWGCTTEGADGQGAMAPAPEDAAAPAPALTPALTPAPHRLHPDGSTLYRRIVAWVGVTEGALAVPGLPGLAGAAAEEGSWIELTTEYAPASDAIAAPSPALEAPLPRASRVLTEQEINDAVKNIFKHNADRDFRRLPGLHQPYPAQPSLTALQQFLVDKGFDGANALRVHYPHSGSVQHTAIHEGVGYVVRPCPPPPPPSPPALIRGARVFYATGERLACFRRALCP